jgi:RNA-binding protein 39
LRAPRWLAEHSKVLDAFVVKDRDTGESRGFGFVIFQTERSMNDAIDAMDGQDLGGRTIRVNPAGDLSASAPRSAGGGNGGGGGRGSGGSEGNTFRCYVGGLNFSTREASLRSAFSEFGDLLECTVVMENDDPERSRGFGFVACTYPTDAHASRRV